MALMKHIITLFILFSGLFVSCSELVLPEDEIEAPAPEDDKPEEEEKEEEKENVENPKEDSSGDENACENDSIPDDTVIPGEDTIPDNEKEDEKPSDDEPDTSDDGENDNDSDEEDNTEDEEPTVIYDGSYAHPYNIATFLATTELPADEFYVKGYIVGYVTGWKMTGLKTELPDTDRPNIAIADSPLETDGMKCIPIKLTNTKCKSQGGTYRELLNLYDNPENKGRCILLKAAKAETYFSQKGIKVPKDFEWVHKIVAK